ncbi:hypothetical protein O1611_g5921 [Lasiodiplodia mahajangana]|uniref:Uncharacterized protein n=1 Tax=Lasiodiplodia mahajangana TaxID=1108764 RepID=A0ACC2JJK9_9PEZI|nr:hypothetical protein O1611_g5921 [Lasiodiplodia mahajangana]
MSYNSQILMSGTFHLDLPNSGGGSGSPFSGVHPGLFRPPASPSVSSSVYLGKSTGSLQSESPGAMYNTKRKRAGDWAMASDRNFSRDVLMEDRSDYDMSTYGKEGRYVLAGQIATPNGGAQKDFGQMEDSVYSDIDYRRALGSKRSRDDVDSPASRPMMVDSDNEITGSWKSYAISTIGGVVGRVWEFCKAGAFRGFYAGGGTGYEILEGSDQSTRDTSPFYGSPCLPQSDYSPYYYERETPESTPPPAPKRRQISNGTPTDELRKNWVMIDEPVPPPLTGFEVLLTDTGGGMYEPPGALMQTYWFTSWSHNPLIFGFQLVN